LRGFLNLSFDEFFFFDFFFSSLLFFSAKKKRSHLLSNTKSDTKNHTRLAAFRAREKKKDF